MSQWNNTDTAANSVLWAVGGYNRTVNTANRDAFFGNTTPDAFIDGIAVGQFGATPNEVTAESAITHAGWVVRKEGTGGRAGRVTYETLVAMGSLTGDAEDVILKDLKVVFTLQPVNASANAGSAVTFTAAAVSAPTGTPVTYVWQRNSGSVFANLTNTGVYSGANTATLAISNVAGLNANQFRVLALASGANTVTSNAAVLTVTA